MGQAAAEGVELVLGVELLHLLGLALRIVRIALLKLHELGLKHLHARRGARGLEHEGRQDESDDDDQDDDGQAPVNREALDELQDLEEDGNDPVPHVCNLR